MTRSTRSFWLVLALLALAGACESDRAPRGVPPASQWKSPEPKPSVVGTARQGSGRASPHGASGDPHAGLDVDDPHAGMGGDRPAGDPHAGLDIGHGADVEGLEAPDPDRPIDKSKFLRGQIRADKAAAGRIKPGAILFLSAWPIDEATGEILGSPLAVDRLDVASLPLEFNLDESHMMVKGTRFEGEVLVTARVDADGEARTKEPGDVEGSVRARVPAGDIVLVLDSVLR